MKVYHIPADSRLYSSAAEYIACVVAMKNPHNELIVSALDVKRSEVHAEFEAALVKYNIEFYDKEDVLNIACQLTQQQESEVAI